MSEYLSRRSLLSRNGTPVEGLHDVVSIPVDKSVRIRLKFNNYKGITVYHCHNLDHEDFGMMGVIRVN